MASSAIMGASLDDAFLWDVLEHFAPSAFRIFSRDKYIGIYFPFIDLVRNFISFYLFQSYTCVIWIIFNTNTFAFLEWPIDVIVLLKMWYFIIRAIKCDFILSDSIASGNFGLVQRPITLTVLGICALTCISLPHFHILLYRLVVLISNILY